MAFVLPEFNLDCDIFTGPWATKVFRLTSPCNLAFGKRTMVVWVNDYDPENQPTQLPVLLLLPALTDIRTYVMAGQSDIVEVPSGSGRIYSVAAVEDAGKGFDNEHRVALIFPVSQFVDPAHWPGVQWPVPMP